MNRLLTTTMLIVNDDDPTQDLEVSVDVGGKCFSFSVAQEKNKIWFTESDVMYLLEAINRFKESYKDRECE